MLNKYTKNGAEICHIKSSKGKKGKKNPTQQLGFLNTNRLLKAKDAIIKQADH